MALEMPARETGGREGWQEHQSRQKRQFAGPFALEGGLSHDDVQVVAAFVSWSVLLES